MSEDNGPDMVDKVKSNEKATVDEHAGKNKLQM